MEISMDDGEQLIVSPFLDQGSVNVKGLTAHAY